MAEVQKTVIPAPLATTVPSVGGMAMEGVATLGEIATPSQTEEAAQ